jgi:hypothetical protein
MILTMFSSIPARIGDPRPITLSRKPVMPDASTPAWPLEAIFSLANGLALIAWLALALTPPRATWAPRVRLATGRIVPLTLAVAYIVLIGAHWGPGGYGS